MKRYFRAVARYGARAVAFGRQRAVRFGELWRRSLQVRVVISTLALSSAVVFVLGMVLQNQITERLLETKEEAAIAATRDSIAVAQRELIGVNPSVDAVRNRLTQALNKLTSSTPNTDTVSSSAGTFEPVLASESPDLGDASMISVGPYGDVPDGLRHFVENKRLAVQIHTVDRPTGRTTFLMVGAPFGTAQQLVHLYMLFPLSAEQSTIAVVQSTLLVGGLVLLLLLAGIANLVTRQVVRPVRSAAQAAERFADGDLDERMIVIGEDDVARLAESYNEMAESIQRQIRQLEEFGTLQRRFTSDVSHELRTPLTTVRMAADVLHASREQFPPGLSRSTELLVDELDRFESLLGDLLEISRLDAGVEELISEDVDVRPIAVRAAQAVATIARNAGTEIILDLPDEEVAAEVDARRIERIMRNLLANAVDHGDGHPVRLRMAVDDHALAVTVRDYGVGLRTGEADLVFNRFWRADPSRNRHTGGTGLGLAISLEDARLHGGGLDAWGEPGKGACFRLTLPRWRDVEYTESPLALPPPDADVPNVVAADVEPFTETDAVRVTVAGMSPDQAADDADTETDADEDRPHRSTVSTARPANITGSVTGSVTGAYTIGTAATHPADLDDPSAGPDDDELDGLAWPSNQAEDDLGDGAPRDASLVGRDVGEVADGVVDGDADEVADGGVADRDAGDVADGGVVDGDASEVADGGVADRGAGGVADGGVVGGDASGVADGGVVGRDVGEVADAVVDEDAGDVADGGVVGGDASEVADGGLVGRDAGEVADEGVVGGGAGEVAGGGTEEPAGEFAWDSRDAGAGDGDVGGLDGGGDAREGAGGGADGFVAGTARGVGVGGEDTGGVVGDGAEGSGGEVGRDDACGAAGGVGDGDARDVADGADGATDRDAVGGFAGSRSGSGGGRDNGTGAGGGVERAAGVREEVR